MEKRKGRRGRRKGRRGKAAEVAEEGGWVVRWNDGQWEQSEEAGWLAG